MRQIGVDGSTGEFVASPALSTSSPKLPKTAPPGERPWGKRENAILGATVVAALLVASAIVLL
jgi:hypothetical protein